MVYNSFILLTYFVITLCRYWIGVYCYVCIKCVACFVSIALGAIDCCVCKKCVAIVVLIDRCAADCCACLKCVVYHYECLFYAVPTVCTCVTEGFCFVGCFELLSYYIATLASRVRWSALMLVFCGALG